MAAVVAAALSLSKSGKPVGTRDRAWSVSLMSGHEPRLASTKTVALDWLTVVIVDRVNNSGDERN
jgi:hypothetical protein